MTLRGTAPTSVAQEGLWFIDQLDGGSAQYALVFAFRFRGDLVVRALEHGLNQVVARHGALRTTLVEQNGRPLQRIADELPVRLTVEEVPGGEEAVRKRLSEEATHAFDLAEGPLFRASLLRSTERDHVLVLAVHHAVFDGHSLDLLMEELREFYAAEVESRRPEVEPVGQYADFARSEHEWMKSADSTDQLEFWQRFLEGAEPLRLPTDRPRSSVSSVLGDTVSFEVPAADATGLDELLRKERVTPFMFLLAVHHLVLARVSGQRDIVVGSPMANRHELALRGAIGYFVNMVALRVDSKKEQTFRDLLRQVRGVSLDAYENQDYPFARLVAHLGAGGRARGRADLVQTALAFENISADAGGWPGLEVDSLDTEGTTAKFDVSFLVLAQNGGFRGTISYRTELFDRSTIESLAEHFVGVLRRAVVEPDTQLSDLLSAGSPRP